MRPQKQDFNETPILKKNFKNVPGEKSVLQFSSKQSPCSQSSEETYKLYILYTHTGTSLVLYQIPSFQTLLFV